MSIRIKDFKYKGKSDEELAAMSLAEFSKLTTSRARRSISKGFTDVQKKLLEKVKAAKEGKRKKPIKTHARDMPIIPELLGQQIQVYDGNKYVPVDVNNEKLGHFLGEFAITRKRVTHKAPGVGATRSSKHQSVK